MKQFAFLCIIIFLFISFSCKIVKHESSPVKPAGDQEIFFSDSGFDPEAYVDTIWDSKVLPCVKRMANDAETILSGLRSDPENTSAKYGYRIGDEGAFYNFAATGRIRILRVDTSSRNGIAYADLCPYDGEDDLILQIGPVFKGSSLRDVLDFISLNSFANQVEYARLGTALNAKVRENVVNTDDPSSFDGKEYTMLSVFTYNDALDLQVMTPVVLEGIED